MKLITYLTMLFLLVAGSAFATEYNYVSQEKMKEQLTEHSNMMIVDIQVKEEFTQHHLPGAVATYAYPVKSDVERSRLNEIVAAQMASGQQVVIICPRGAGGAKRAYDYLKEKGVAEKNLAILEKGMSGWPYKDLTVVGN